MYLYRVQKLNDWGGMWYNIDGTSNRLVDTLTDKRLAQLPMDYDPRYHEGGKHWQCAANSLENLDFWFSEQDRKDLIKMGFVLTRFRATEYIQEELQVLFTRQSIIEIDYTSEFLNMDNLVFHPFELELV